jgi:hypothetical protein
MSTLISEFKSCDDNKLVQLISVQEGDILDFKDCDIILATYKEVDDDGKIVAVYEDRPVVKFKDGSQIGLSKLTTHFVDSKPVRTKIGERVKGRTKKDVVKDLRKLGKWKCTHINPNATTKTGEKTKEYTFEEVEG